MHKVCFLHFLENWWSLVGFWMDYICVKDILMETWNIFWSQIFYVDCVNCHSCNCNLGYARFLFFLWLWEHHCFFFLLIELTIQVLFPVTTPLVLVVPNSICYVGQDVVVLEISTPWPNSILTVSHSPTIKQHVVMMSSLVEIRGTHKRTALNTGGASTAATNVCTGWDKRHWFLFRWLCRVSA